MSILYSRQDIYDYCRSVYTQYYVDMVSGKLKVGSEIILVEPQSYDGQSAIETKTLVDWLHAKERGFIQFYRLYHLKITAASTEEGLTHYTTEPVMDTRDVFPSSAGYLFPITGEQYTDQKGVKWESRNHGLCNLYSLETVVNQLNRIKNPVNQNQIEHLIGDIRERLYPTINDLRPSFYFWRDAFNYRLCWRIGHCSVFYGISFALCFNYIPFLSGIMVIFLLLDIWCSRKAMHKLKETTTLSLYGATAEWRKACGMLQYTPYDFHEWEMQSVSILNNIKMVVAAFLSKRQQKRYVRKINEILERLTRPSLVDSEINQINQEIHQLLIAFSILPRY